ncbi:MAG: hypothetical protein WB812_03835, partial [Woeseiaceae bacterium]
MIRRALLTIAALTTVTILAAVAALGWLVGTEGGTAWLLARGRPYFPQALVVDGVGGTPLGGLHADRIA